MPALQQGEYHGSVMSRVCRRDKHATPVGHTAPEVVLTVREEKGGVRTGIPQIAIYAVVLVGTVLGLATQTEFAVEPATLSQDVFPIMTITAE